MIASLILALVAQIGIGASAQPTEGIGAAGSIFGDAGCPSDSCGSWKRAQLDLLYGSGTTPSGQTAISLTIYRMGIANANSGVGGSSWLDNNPGFQNMMVDAKEVLKRNPNVKIWAAPWSPPAACKVGGSTTTGSCTTACCGATPSDPQWINWIVGAVNEFRASTGTCFYAVSTQNEPDFDPGGAYEGCTFGTAPWVAWVKALGPALAATSCAPRLMGPEVSQWSNLFASGGGAQYIDACTADSACLAQVGLWATHQYPPAVATAPGVLSGRSFWQTELGLPQSGSPDPTMTTALSVAGLIHNAFVIGNVNAWVYWIGVTNSGSTTQGLIESDGVTTTKTLFAVGNFSKFVRPGMIRFATTGSPPAGVSASVYKDPSTNNIAIVAINTGGSTSLTVTLQSGSKVQAITPWVTDATRDLIAQAPVAVAPSSQSFTFTLPASSVTTFAAPGT